MTKIYWNTSAFSLTARIPNNQVTPSTGSSVPSDRNPDLSVKKDFLLIDNEKKRRLSEVQLIRFQQNVLLSINACVCPFLFLFCCFFFLHKYVPISSDVD